MALHTMQIFLHKIELPLNNNNAISGKLLQSINITYFSTAKSGRILVKNNYSLEIYFVCRILVENKKIFEIYFVTIIIFLRQIKY